MKKFYSVRGFCYLAAVWMTCSYIICSQSIYNNYWATIWLYHEKPQTSLASLTRAFAAQMIKHLILNCLLSATQILWPDWVGTKAGLSQCWIITNGVGFVILYYIWFIFTSACLVRNGSGKPKSEMDPVFESCPCLSNLKCEGIGLQDNPLGEIGE